MTRRKVEPKAFLPFAGPKVDGLGDIPKLVKPSFSVVWSQTERPEGGGLRARLFANFWRGVFTIDYSGDGRWFAVRPDEIPGGPIPKIADNGESIVFELVTEGRTETPAWEAICRMELCLGSLERS